MNMTESPAHRPCRAPVPPFPHRSPPWLLTTAASGGLRSTPDCRTRRTFLHLPYSCASPCGPTMLVTQGPTLPSAASAGDGSYLGISCRHWGRRATAEDDPKRPFVEVPSCKRQGLNSSAHSITASAFAIDPRGTSMPSARLMANWNLLACSYRRVGRAG